MIILRALAALHAALVHARGLLARRASDAPATGSAWTGPWPPGALPVCTTYGAGPPIFVGYVAASTDEVPRRDELARFWHAHAAAFERSGVQD